MLGLARNGGGVERVARAAGDLAGDGPRPDGLPLWFLGLERIRVELGASNISRRSRGRLAVGKSVSSIRAAIVPVVLIGLTLRLGFASGFVDLDDRYYIEAAHRISSGNWSVVADHRATRLGVVVPAALVFASFGVGFWQVVMVPLLCSMAGVLVAFEGGRRLFDVRTGLVAALLLCVFPLDVIYSGRLSPTAPIGLWSGTGALLLIGADEHRRWILAGLAGLAFGLAFMCGETPLFVFVVYPAYVLTARPPARRHLAVVAGFLAALVVEAGLTAWMSGDPLTRVWVLLGADTVRAVNVDVAHAGWTVEWLIHPLLRVCTEQELGLFLIVGLPLASVRIFRSTVPAERALAVWVLVFVSMGFVRVGVAGRLRTACPPAALSRDRSDSARDPAGVVAGAHTGTTRDGVGCLDRVQLGRLFGHGWKSLSFDSLRGDVRVRREQTPGAGRRRLGDSNAFLVLQRLLTGDGGQRLVERLSRPDARRSRNRPAPRRLRKCSKRERWSSRVGRRCARGWRSKTTCAWWAAFNPPTPCTAGPCAIRSFGGFSALRVPNTA